MKTVHGRGENGEADLSAPPARKRASRLTFRKLLGRIHLGLGLISGLLVFVIALTGCVYVFEKEIKAFLYRDRLFVPTVPAAPPRPLSELWSTAQAAVGKARPVTRVEIHSDPARAFEFHASRYEDGAWTWHGEEAYAFKAYLDPYSGEVLKVENTKFEFFNLVFWAHWSLLLSTRIGQPIVGTATLVFIAMLLTGLALWWPRHRAALKARLKLDPRAKGKKRTWDLHAVLGFYTLIPALLIALTGLVWAFHWVEDAVYFAATGGGHPKTERVVSDTTRSKASRPPVDAVLEQVRGRHPGFRFLAVTVPGEDPEGVVSAYARLHPHRHFPYAWLQFDRHSGRLLSSESFSDLDRGGKLRTMNYDLHTGSILSLPGKILAFLASLVCASLPVSGLLIWRGRPRKKKP